ncbi:bifunctional tRNA (adenosine(37)-N6)-threonylcarbamoyltransferase complex dimerization subunit type 1 TsaB/ribosomal protein alanine acetyltransferase RimI [Basilea psittacipulmonis]|uniref:N-acetyltransferase domain-containing protein n=1 Tax=Basilea psittacipulmonis DSM 24701 TaxID=1072685 RepID=A0A077DEB8_9BURK|nr:bifunctional tRNA (adenosine(37)-N6)-threonylcarbamoyltransferase complex dimerization subunit type 1 TsaB/ribosomal protein alanine acetyltransferase RimI [Basilea psittacipulmonis]AIL33185.1 hypothetical protein IX83_07660 [Basilea psittacipulmonis DSM 24701]
MSKYIVSIDTSGQGASFSLVHLAGENKEQWSIIDEKGRHKVDGVIPFIEALLEQASITLSDIYALAFNQGPGGFTGLRVACATVQGLASGLNIPVLPIGSLQAMAFEHTLNHHHEFLVSVLDARMEEVFLAVYEKDEHAPFGLLEKQAPCLIPFDKIDDYLLKMKPIWEKERGQIIAFKRCEQTVNANVLSNMAVYAVEHHPDAFIDPMMAQPVYVRNKVAYTILEREQGSGGNPKALDFPFQWREVTIRPMSLSDVPAVVALEALLEQDPWTAGNFIDALNKGYSSWVVVFNGQIIAYLLQLIAPDVAHLMILGVHEAYQGKGIAQVLIQQSHENMIKHGIFEQVLEVREDNTRARDFYEKQGYIEIGKRKGYYASGQIDAIVLSKKVKG